MNGELAVAAIDLGATSGRVIVGRVGADRVDLQQVARFANHPVALPDGLHWDLLHLYAEALEGLRVAAAAGDLAGVAVDAWAVDYGLLRDDALIGVPYAYRDTRGARGVARVHAEVPFTELYRRNGLQFLPFNTLYQLSAEAPPGLGANRLLMIPDLLTYWLSGEAINEVTNASSTGLLDPRTRTWDADLMGRLRIPRGLFSELVEPGVRVGVLRGAAAEQVGVEVPVLTAPSHDTAAAVLAVPMDPERAAYISCGTWGLVGVETLTPILTDAARAANFTNEGGVDGTTRFLRNVMGLWMLTETLRAWERAGRGVDLVAILAAASSEPEPVALLDVDDDVFLAPGRMPERIDAWLTSRSLPVPTSQAAMVRLIVESLAQAFAQTVQAASELSGVPVERIHVVGGGSRNALLCQLTADRAGVPVVAGPVEATALGNVLAQARGLGRAGDRASVRTLVAASTRLASYVPAR
jgi:rhamnulokinase